ncbi:hypothetical protein [Salsipaludibacter albus]|uniref:hypothetical protein n=1 Tax=Salsipaludibacter albus TaxID=2849650 RepID=UPI001EE3F103|nr:hypothetical protein [Salsipaludibacter albus]MBY5164406.1 hypothetical protein [Salsipaludibacter albus]
MDDVPTPRELRGAAGVARTLAYAAGAVGVVAGVLLYQGGDTAFAIAVWVLTFGVGALLMIAAFLLHGMVALLARLHALESDVRVLVGRRSPDLDEVDGPRGPDPHPNPW